MNTLVFDEVDLTAYACDIAVAAKKLARLRAGHCRSAEGHAGQIRNELDDARQDVIIHLIVQLRKYPADEERNPRAYVARMLNRFLVDEYRKRVRRVETFQMFEHFDAPAVYDARADIEAALVLGLVSPEVRAVLAGDVWPEQKSNVIDIAARFGIGAQTLSARVKRSRQKLQDTFHLQ